MIAMKRIYEPERFTRFHFGYSGLSKTQALDLQDALITGRCGVKYPQIYDRAERDARIAELAKIIQEQQ